MTVPPPGDGPDAGRPVVPLLLGAHWHADEPGGLPRYLSDLYGALRRQGLHPRATVVGPASDAPFGVVTGGRLGDPLPLRVARFALAAVRASPGVDVVDVHFALYSAVPTVVGGLRRLPLVVHFQGPWALESAASGDAARWRVAAKRLVETAVYRRARAVVVLSHAFRQVLVERYGIAPWVVEVVPPGVDLERFTPGDRRTARRRLDLPPAATVVVAVRRLVPRMGLDVLVEAWAKVQPSLADGHLLIVGDGPEGDALRRLADRTGAGPSVRLLGGVDEQTLLECYRAADVSVVPTVALEGFGLVVLESLACGTPCVVTDAGGLPEAVRALDASVVVPAGDASALAGRLSRGLDGTEPFPVGERCRDHARSFGWPAVARRHEEIYTAARRGPSRPRVVYLDHCARLSGGELALLRLLPSLDVDAHVILGEDGPLVARLRAAGVSVEVLEMGEGARTVRRDLVSAHRLPVSAAAEAAVHTLRLARRLWRLRPDLVHTNSLKAALYGGAAARLAAVPVVWHLRDRVADDYLPAPAQRLVRIAARVVPSAVIANSAATLDALRTSVPSAAVIPSPVSSFGGPRPPRRGALRVGMLGRVAPWKGQHVFLEAFAEAFPDGTEVGAIVGEPLFGEDGYRHELGRQVARLGLAERVEFRGFRDDVEHELGRLDVLVHASTIPEPFGQVVVEGMAAGLAVVAADAGGPAEVVRDGVDGLLYAPGDVGALASHLRRLVADGALRARLGEQARGRAAEYTVDRVAPQVMDVYRGVLAGVRSPAQGLH